MIGGITNARYVATMLAIKYVKGTVARDILSIKKTMSLVDRTSDGKFSGLPSIFRLKIHKTVVLR